jgi:hypothetical protein
VLVTLTAVPLALFLWNFPIASFRVRRKILVGPLDSAIRLGDPVTAVDRTTCMSAFRPSIRYVVVPCVGCVAERAIPVRYLSMRGCLCAGWPGTFLQRPCRRRVTSTSDWAPIATRMLAKLHLRGVSLPAVDNRWREWYFGRTEDPQICPRTVVPFLMIALVETLATIPNFSLGKSASDWIIGSYRRHDAVGMTVGLPECNTRCRRTFEVGLGSGTIAETRIEESRDQMAMLGSIWASPVGSRSEVVIMSSRDGGE